MYGISFPQGPGPTIGIPSSSQVYAHILDGAMEFETQVDSYVCREHTPKGIPLLARDNPLLLKQLGDELLLFAEWCQNRCSWRRRGYLAVVDELTRIIHASFSQAQIEVFFVIPNSL